MQTLWARALQVKSTCRCPACANPQRALARRVNTAPAKRSSRTGELAFSALFSTSIAAGAMADAKYKLGKREDLDGALVAAREDLRAVEADQGRRLRALGLDIPERPQQTSSQDNESTDVWLEQTSSEQVENMQTWQASEPLSIKDDTAPLSSVHSSAPQLKPQAPNRKKSSSKKADTYKTNVLRKVPKRDRGSDTQKNNTQRKEAERKEVQRRRRTLRNGSQFYAEVDTSIPSREALSRLILSPKPVDTTLGKPDCEVWASSATPPATRRGALQCQNAVATLIYKIILFRLNRTNGFRVTFPDGTRTFVESDLSEIQETVRQLVTRRGIIQSSRVENDLIDDTEPLRFPPYEWATHGERRRALRESSNQETGLLDLFSKSTSLDQLLSELCSMLACHSQPLNIHMFNILIIRLSYLQLPRLVTHVIDAMEETSRIQNEITHTAVLQCYIDSNNSPKFHEHLNNMDGLMGKGYLPNKQFVVTQDRNPASEIQSYPVAKHALNGFRSGAKEVRNYKAPRTLQMYEAIIEGLLKFKNVQRALAEYSRLVRSDLVPTIVIYRSFLEYCVKFKAWTIGWLIWHHLSDNMHVDDPLVYYWMLQLCASCNRDSEFKAVNQQAIRQNIIGCELNIESFQWTKSEFDETFLNANAVRSLQRNIQVPGYPTEVLGKLHSSSRWHTSLSTFLRERLQVLSQEKEDAVGFSLQDGTHEGTERLSGKVLNPLNTERDKTTPIQELSAHFSTCSVTGPSKSKAN